MAVTHDDVRNIAGLARLAVPAERLDTLVAELNAILAHMDALGSADTSEALDEAETARGMRTGTDVGTSVSLLRPPSAFAPEWRDGFFLVPRLATHGDAGAVVEDGE